MKKVRLRRIIASVVAFSVINTCTFSNNTLLAYANTNTENVADVSKAHSLKDGVKDTISTINNSAINEDLNLMYKADDEVEIIVELESKPVLEHYVDENSTTGISSFVGSSKGQKISDKLLKEQKNITNKILSEVSSEIEVTAEYTVAMNGFAVKAKFSDLESIKEINGVKNAFISTIHELPTQPEVEIDTKMVNSSGTIGAVEANKSGYTGKETVVAVIDTGLDLNHEAFETVPENIKYSEEEISEILKNNKLNASGSVYKNGKVPFAYDYADKDDNPNDVKNHGTHVAGTVAANSEKITGVAPDAQLMILKVFSDKGGGASDVNILAALDDAVTLGADSINMSLGSAAGFTEEAEDVLNRTYNRVAYAGISLICSAGNDNSSSNKSNKGDLPLVSNPDNGIVGSPSTYNAATSVASVNNVKSLSPYFLMGESKMQYTDTNQGGSKAFTSLQGENIEYVAVPGVGTIEDFESVDVSGKIALVKRGAIAFTEKEYNANNYGAVGLIIYDNVDGALINMQTNGIIPMIFISKSNGEMLVNEESKNININESYIDGFEDATSGLMSDFSSWGITTDLKLKPEITAPGGSIYSSLPGGGYGSMNGTSMASPHVAGATALVRQYLNEKYDNLTAKEEDALLTNLLMSTASTVIDGNGVAYSPRKQGAGLMNVNNAIKSGAYLTTSTGKPKAELGESLTGEYLFSFDVNNSSDNSLSYTVDTTVLTEKIVSANGEKFFAQESEELDTSKVAVTLDGVEGNNITVEPGKTKTITVSLNLTEEGKKSLEICENGTFIDGFVTLISNNEDKINLNLPFVGFYGDWQKAPIFDKSIYVDEESIMYETALGNFDTTTGSGYYLGMNLFTKNNEPAIVDEDKIAIGADINAKHAVSGVVGLLRSTDNLTYSVVNSNGDTVYEKNTGKQQKSYYYSTGGFNTYAIDEYGFDAIEWNTLNPMNDGEYTYKISTNPIGGDLNNKEEITFPLTIDTEKPQLVKTEPIKVDGKNYLKVTVTDNHYLQAMQLVDDKGNPLSDVIVLDSDKKGSEYEVLFDVEGAEEIGSAKVVVIDYARNMFESEAFDLTEPKEIIVGKVSNLKANNVTSNSLTLSWDAPIETEGLVGYVLYKDGKIMAEVNELNYEVSGLRKNTNYGFKVAAKYSNGEESKPKSVNVRTKK